MTLRRDTSVPTSFSLPAPGKLNLCLNIVGRRADGYHELQTVFQLLDVADSIDFEMAATITVETEAEIDPEQNLVYLAAKSLKAYCGIDQGARLILTKNLPLGAGMGGGSSDAATTLIGLNLLWQTGLDSRALLALGAPLGADVPVFIRGRSAWAEGIGEVLSEIDLPHKYFVVVQPGCQTSTAEIFSQIDLDVDLTRDRSTITIARFLEHGSGNDCEAVVRRLYPEVDAALRWLNKRGAARMTGTGSSVFVDFESEREAEALLQEIPSKWNAFVAEGLSESPLINAVNQLRQSLS